MAEEEYELTNVDWGKIHAKAWREEEFRRLLETDPTKAVRDYAQQNGLKVTKIVKLRPAPDPHDIPPEFWDDVNPFPPSCC
ncbi:MAG: hypothetical protein ACXVCF_15700 [Isosphaeraceae bacterium]